MTGDDYGYYPSKYGRTVLLSPKQSFFEVLVDGKTSYDFVPDAHFLIVIELYQITEEVAMEWMIEDGNFDRDWLRSGFIINNPHKYDFNHIHYGIHIE